MGRGRAKAKQVKVARQLKYNGGGTDLNRLRAELGVGTEAQSADHDDPYAEYDDEDALDDDRRVSGFHAEAPGLDRDLGRTQQRAQALRLQVRRHHHLLRVHAGRGHGQRPSDGLRLSGTLRGARQKGAQ